MRLYRALLVAAIALLASNVSAGGTDCAMTPDEDIDSVRETAPEDSFEGFDSSNDLPVQQPNSDVDSNQDVSHDSEPITRDSFEGFDPSNDLPVQQPNSDVDSNQDVSPDSEPITRDSFEGFDSSNDLPVQQSLPPSLDVGASQESSPSNHDVKQGDHGSIRDDVYHNADVAGEADVNFQPMATPAAPTIVPSFGPSKSSASNSPLSDNSKLCANPRVRITEVDVGAVVDSNEEEAALKLVAIAALPSGGSRIAFHSGNNVIVRELDANDKLVSGSTAIKVPFHDFADLYADKNGFVILGTRDAKGGGTLNCGNPSNLCGSPPNPPVPCYDMYMVRYDGTSETWATKLTSSSASLPPYSLSKTGADVYMIWWYAHHGRIAFDGTNWAAYFGAAISTSEGGCINIHQGDRMKVVSPSGTITADQDSFDWGCSHSAYERITYDNRTDSYATICKTDSGNRIMPPKDWDTTIYPVDLGATNLGDIVPDSNPSSKKYWATVSNGSGDRAKVHLIHFAKDAAASEDITLGGTDVNERAPHLASIGNGGMLAVWEGSSSSGDLVEGSDRTMYAQVLDASTGKAISQKVTVDKSVVGNRYQALKTYPDGSVAYLSKGKTDTSLQVVRFFGC